MPPEEKRKYSHRAAAAKALLQSGALEHLHPLPSTGEGRGEGDGKQRL
jgi:hypothetical protein